MIVLIFSFAIGGFNGHLRQKSVEKLDPRTGQWQHVRDMTITRSNCGVEAMGDKVNTMENFFPSFPNEL